jgi:flagellar motility protein MotE (MotC chaperone)
MVRALFDEVLVGEFAGKEVQKAAGQSEKTHTLDFQAELVRKVFRSLEASIADCEKRLQTSRGQDEKLRDLAGKHEDLTAMLADIELLLSEALAKCGKVCETRRERARELVPTEKSRFPAKALGCMCAGELRL